MTGRGRGSGMKSHNASQIVWPDYEITIWINQATRSKVAKSYCIISVPDIVLETIHTSTVAYYNDDLRVYHDRRLQEHPDPESCATLLRGHSTRLYPTAPTRPFQRRLSISGELHTGRRSRPLRQGDRVPTPALCTPAGTQGRAPDDQFSLLPRVFPPWR